MRIQNKIVLGFAIVLAIASAASAQRRRIPVNPDEVGVTISLQVAGQPYQFEGKAVRRRLLCQPNGADPLI